MNAEAYVAGAAQVGPRRSTLGAWLPTSRRLLNQGLALLALPARSPTARAEWQRDRKQPDDPRAMPAQPVSPDRPYVEQHMAAADVRSLRKTVHGPVGAAYFAATPPAERHPLVVGASRVADPLATAAFDQLALLLGSGGLGLAFHWLGPLDPVPAARLKAAHVDVFDPQDDVERATRMAAGWIFVAMGTGHRFPISLVEAMATGLPCVVMDNPGHRSLVHHGETGYLCRSPGEAVDRIAQLADTPSLRERMGRAGRALALARFGERRFRDTLLAAYAALPMPAAANAHTHQRLQSRNSSSASDRL